MTPEPVLVRLLEQHIEQVRLWRNSADVSKYMYTSKEITADEQRAWFKKIERDPSVIYWVITAGEQLLGVANLFAIRGEPYNSCSWAFYLGDTKIRGAKIGSKVEFQVIEHVFNDLKLDKLNCEVLSSNEVVINMHEGFGFRREGYFRKHVSKDNARHDVVGLALLREEWSQVRGEIHKRIYDASL